MVSVWKCSVPSSTTAPLVKNSRLVLMVVYGANTPLGKRTMVCSLQSRSSSFFSVPLMPSPKRNPSGSTTAARPFSFSSFLTISAMNMSAVSRVLRSAG